MRSARDSCLRSVSVFGIGVIIPSSFTKFYALPTSPMFARMRTDDATTFTATVSSCTRIQSPMMPISVRPFKTLPMASPRIFASSRTRKCASLRLRKTRNIHLLGDGYRMVHPSDTEPPRIVTQVDCALLRTLPQWHGNQVQIVRRIVYHHRLIAKNPTENCRIRQKIKFARQHIPIA